MIGEAGNEYKPFEIEIIVRRNNCEGRKKVRADLNPATNITGGKVVSWVREAISACKAKEVRS